MNRFHYHFHVLIYYIVWTAGILSAANGFAWISTFIILIGVSLQYYWQYHVHQQYKGMNTWVFIITTLGIVVDSTFLHLNLINFYANPFSHFLSPPWMIALWINFALVFYSTLFHLFQHLYILAVLSFLGFSFAYAIGVKTGAAFFPGGYFTAFLIGLVWMILLPLSVYFFNRINHKLC